MVFDPIWNSFTNSGNINDYLAYKRKKEERDKKVTSAKEKTMDSFK